MEEKRNRRQCEHNDGRWSALRDSEPVLVA
jgi:hypothetical protein